MEEQNIRIHKNQRGQAPTELPFYLQEVKTKHEKQVKRIFQLEMLRQRMNQPSLPKLRGPHSTLRHLGGGKASQESLDQTPTQGQEDQPPGRRWPTRSALHPHHGDSDSLLNTGPGSSRPL